MRLLYEYNVDQYSQQQHILSKLVRLYDTVRGNCTDFGYDMDFSNWAMTDLE